jgi:hypothetical protein
MMITNAAAVTGIASRVREIAGERGLRGLGIEAARALHVRGERMVAFLRPRLSA